MRPEGTLLRPAVLRAAAARAALLAGIWWALAEGAGTGWGLGVAVVALAVVTSLWLQPPGGPSPRPRAVPGFALWFVRRSVAGGVDVARRALRRPVDIAPGLVQVPVRLPAGWPSVVLADAVSLLPGTLAVTLHPGRIELHVLDERLPVAEEVRELEERVGRLFGVDLAGGPVLRRQGPTS
jgi:multicomponent Na+:H+ antiporter subunit E